MLLLLLILVIPKPYSTIHIIIPICLFLHRFVPFVSRAYTCVCVWFIWIFNIWKTPNRRWCIEIHICAVRIPKIPWYLSLLRWLFHLRFSISLSRHVSAHRWDRTFWFRRHFECHFINGLHSVFFFSSKIWDVSLRFNYSSIERRLESI